MTRYFQVKVLKKSAYIIDKHVTNINSNNLLKNLFSDSAKIALVRPIYKKGETADIVNDRPVNISNCLFKIYEKLHNQITYFSNNFFQISSLLAEKDTVQIMF